MIELNLHGHPGCYSPIDPQLFRSSDKQQRKYLFDSNIQNYFPLLEDKYLTFKNKSYDFFCTYNSIILTYFLILFLILILLKIFNIIDIPITIIFIVILLLIIQDCFFKKDTQLMQTLNLIIKKTENFININTHMNFFQQLFEYFNPNKNLSNNEIFKQIYLFISSYDNINDFINELKKLNINTNTLDDIRLLFMEINNNNDYRFLNNLLWKEKSSNNNEEIKEKIKKIKNKYNKFNIWTYILYMFKIDLYNNFLSVDLINYIRYSYNYNYINIDELSNILYIENNTFEDRYTIHQKKIKIINNFLQNISSDLYLDWFKFLEERYSFENTNNNMSNISTLYTENHKFENDEFENDENIFSESKEINNENVFIIEQK